MSKFSSFKKYFVNALVIIGAVNAFCLAISGIFFFLAIAAIALGHAVTESGIGSFSRGYVKLIFTTNWPITALTIISVCMFVLFMIYKTCRQEEIYKRSSIR